MRRREFIGTVGTTIVTLTARSYAQGPARMPRVAIVAVATKIEDITINGAPAFRGFFSELKKQGYVEGTNLLIERYSALGQMDRFQDVAQAAVERAPDVIVTWSTGLALLLKSLTTTIPIVASTADPVAQGLVTNLARPEANVTGVSSDAGLGIWSKRLQVLVDAAPTVKNIRFLVTDDATNWARTVFETMSPATQRLNISIRTAMVGKTPGPDAYQRAFQQLAAEQVDGLVMADGAEHVVNRELIVQLAAQYRLPTIYAFREFVQAGGLLSYGIDLADSARRMAAVTVEMLNGKRPGHIPFYQQVRFELILNRATARSIALEFPASLLAIADEVIE